MMVFDKIIGFLIKKIALKVKSYNIIEAKVRRGKECFIVGSELRGNVLIGNNCKIRNAKISGNVKIGRYTSLAGRNIEIVANVNTVKIGSFCSIASNTLIQEFNHPITKLSTYYLQKHIFEESVIKDRRSKGNVEIGSDVWIGKNAVIMSGVKVGNGAIIGSNAVVTNDVPAYSIVGGVPAKVIRYRFNKDVINLLQEINWWDWSIEDIRTNKWLFEKEEIRLKDLEDLAKYK